MKVIVNAKVEYTYEVDVPMEDLSKAPCSFETYCDSADPVYERITKMMNYEGLDFEGTILEIINKETGEMLYEN